MKQSILLLLLLLSLPALAQTEAAVRRQLARRPASTLQDLYKSFFQDRMGPTHLVADTASARRYLHAEVAEALLPDSIEPCGAGRRYCRVPLALVREGRMSEDSLLHLFLQSARPVTPADVKAWRHEWRTIQRTIRRMHLALPHYRRDRRRLRRMLRRGQYAVHHSPAYAARYQPHYRIVLRQLLLP